MSQENEEDALELPNNIINNNSKRKSRPKTPDAEKAAKHAILSLVKPSYCLGLGSKKLRLENRDRVTVLLRRLMSQHRWTEACGVLSVLLKSTSNDTSLVNNRFKYSALMEVLEKAGGEYFSERTIKNIYDIWIRKIGSSKNQQDEQDSFAVRLGFILFSLNKGDVEDAHQAALWLMQERNFGRDPVDNMVVGLTFYQLWLSTIPKELLLSTGDVEASSPGQSQDLITYSEGCADEASTSFQCDSATSVRNDKSLAADGDGDNGLHVHDSVRLDIVKVENLPQNNRPRGNASESTGNETSMSNRVEISPYNTTLSALEGLDPLLFPIQLPQSIGDGQDLYNLHMKLLNDYYKEALKHLSVAVCSTTTSYEALLPFIQLLLIGGKVDEALSELEKLCCDSTAALPTRLRACIVEHFDRINIAKVSTCYEDILKKDPTSCYALEKLITMHKKGEYDNESLLEMIAWHLEGTFASYDTWKELASCFLKLLEIEEDRMSVCQDGNQSQVEQRCSASFSTIPKMFTQGQSGKNWRRRCRCWLNRHFNYKMLSSEIAKGNLQLLAYKAVCACHMYGPERAYVTGAYTCLVKQNERDLVLLLEQSMKKSLNLYPRIK